MKSFRDFWESVGEFLKTSRLLGVRLDNLLLKLLFISSLIATIIWMLPSERPFEYSNLTVGSISPEEIIAPFKFAIQKTSEELEYERNQARAAVPPVFDRITDIEKVQPLKLVSMFGDLEKFFAANTLPEENQRPSNARLGMVRAGVDSLLQQLKVKYALNLDPNDLVELHGLYRSGKFSLLTNILHRGITEVYKHGLLDRAKSDLPGARIVLIEEGIEQEYSLEEVMDKADAAQRIGQLLQSRLGDTALSTQTSEHLLSAFFLPNLVYNEAISNERIENAVHDVPLTRGYVEQDERIIDSNEKVSEEVYQKLLSLSVALKERSAQESEWQQLEFFIGKLLFALTVLFLTILYLFFYRKAIFQNNRMLSMITVIFLLQFAAAILIQKLTHWPAITIPIVLAPMLLAMLLDFGVAFIGTVSISLILGSAFGNDYVFTFMTLIVGSMAMFSVKKIRNRSQMFRAILFILISYLTVDFIFGLLHLEPLKDIFRDFAYYLLPNGLLAPTVAFFLIGIFERIFDVTTDVKLLELSDLNHPLLKQLSVKAPGTFHHSIVVANLAESAALAIKANSLLTRVGCYFHDVGKMDKPEYFVENQMGGQNKHDSLTPRMSCLILVNHVKEGLKLAAKYKLPQAVRQFIPEHHGTSLIAYFYHRAVETSDEKDINESDYRYPGPKPQCRETAIAMLADGVEASSRALGNPTPQRIRHLVETMVNQRVSEGQLDECDLTLNHINLIKEAFIPILTGIHHLRIEYPGEPEKEKKPAKEKTRPLPPAVKPAEPSGNSGETPKVESPSRTSYEDNN